MRHTVVATAMVGLSLVLAACGATAPSDADQHAMRDRAAELLQGEPGPVLLMCTWVPNAGLLEGLNEHSSGCYPLIEVPANAAAIRAALFWLPSHGRVDGDGTLGTFAGKDVPLDRAFIVVADGPNGLDSVGWHCDTDYQLRKEPENDAEATLGGCRLVRSDALYDRHDLIAADG